MYSDTVCVMSQVRKQAEAARQIAARELRAGNFINDSAFRVGNAANTGPPYPLPIRIF